MRIAAIDIGTNTLLLLIADIDERGEIQTVHHEQRLPRLGKDVDVQKSIHPAAFDRIAWIVNEYANIARQFKAGTTVVCATSAVRDAGNQREFLGHIRGATGINVEVLSGSAEALLTYRGAMSGFPEFGSRGAVLDIGGGSTELIYPDPEHTNGGPGLNLNSMQVGSVRIAERFFKDDPPRPEQIESAKSYIVEELSSIRNSGFHRYPLVGVAGTMTTLACLDQQLIEFEVEKVAGHRMTLDRVNSWLLKLSRVDSGRIRAMSGATKGREDILTAGVLILHETMKMFSFKDVIASERGLRFGMILREWENRVTGGLSTF